MSHTVHCKKLGITSEGLDSPPYPGPLGQRIYENISKQAWQEWVNHQTMLINEYRLSLIDKEARRFLQNEMQLYLFGEGSSTPPGYIKPKE